MCIIAYTVGWGCCTTCYFSPDCSLSYLRSRRIHFNFPNGVSDGIYNKVAFESCGRRRTTTHDPPCGRVAQRVWCGTHSPACFGGIEGGRWWQCQLIGTGSIRVEGDEANRRRNRSRHHPASSDLPSSYHSSFRVII